MGKIIDRRGIKVNNWTFVEFNGINKHGESLWLCRCDCGIEKVQVAGNVANGGSRRCEVCSRTPRAYEHELPEVMWELIVRRATKKRCEMTITREEAYLLFVEQDKRCALSGLEIRFATSGTDYLGNNQTASLDRKESSGGYTLGNVQWVHKRINIMKNVMCDADFIRFCKCVADYKTN